MGRTKKQETFTPSKYQKDIFDFIQNGQGNLVVEAVAGSGKSTTLVQSLKLIDEHKSILFCAFNKDIVQELKKKVGKQANVDIKTVHGLGYHILLHNWYEHEIGIDDNKYRTHIYSELKNYSTLNLQTMGKRRYIKYVENILKIINHIRYNLASDIDHIEQICEMHDIALIEDEIYVALQALKWGKEHIKTIDFTDMVWLPNVYDLNMGIFEYDYIFCDEAQDISIAQRELLLKCGKEDTRYIFCGDNKQSIYAFADAAPDAFAQLKKLPNTTSLPLSISYRCPQKVVGLAQRYVPMMECREGGNEGTLQYGAQLQDANSGDMILCRNNSPLMHAYFELISLGKQASVRGREIGSNLKRIIKGYDNEPLNVDLHADGVFVKLYASLFSLRDHLKKQMKADDDIVMNTSIFMSRVDEIKTLECIAKQVNTTQELIDKIDSIFSDKENDGIILSTIHKAKGLEANNVFILCPQLMPSKSATMPWEIEQENNLIYVAYTRAKEKLGFINGSQELLFHENSLSSLKDIEIKVKAILQDRVKTIKTIPKSILTTQKPSLRTTKTKNLTTIKTNTHTEANPFASLVGHKKIKRK